MKGAVPESEDKLRREPISATPLSRLAIRKDAAVAVSESQKSATGTLGVAHEH
jgi:hypothetical protein